MVIWRQRRTEKKTWEKKRCHPVLRKCLIPRLHRTPVIIHCPLIIDMPVIRYRLCHLMFSLPKDAACGGDIPYTPRTLRGACLFDPPRIQQRGWTSFQRTSSQPDTFQHAHSLAKYIQRNTNAYSDVNVFSDVNVCSATCFVRVCLLNYVFSVLFLLIFFSFLFL